MQDLTNISEQQPAANTVICVDDSDEEAAPIGSLAAINSVPVPDAFAISSSASQETHDDLGEESDTEIETSDSERDRVSSSLPTCSPLQFPERHMTTTTHDKQHLQVTNVYFLSLFFFFFFPFGN